MKLRENIIRKIVKTALEEDIAGGDITAHYTVPAEHRSEARIFSKQEGVICGTEIVSYVFSEISQNIEVEILKRDGSKLFLNDKVIAVSGYTRELLLGERTALNFLSHLSGIATYTRRMVDKVKKKNRLCDLYDTRKTLPGLRAAEKYAVKTGGGVNHRMDLGDRILIKENHIKAAGCSVGELVKKIRNSNSDIFIEAEVSGLKQLGELISARIDVIMLDNFNLDDIHKAVRIKQDKRSSVIIEVSGGVNYDNIEAYALAGVDRISVGKLTSSAEALDFSMLLI